MNSTIVHTKASRLNDTIVVVGPFVLARPAGEEDYNQIDSVSCLTGEGGPEATENLKKQSPHDSGVQGAPH